MSDEKKPLLERIKRECHDNPLRSAGTILSLLLSSTALIVSIYWNNQRESAIPYAHIEATAFPVFNTTGKVNVHVEWHNDHSKPIVMVDNDLRLFDGAGNVMSITCCNAVNPKSDQMKAEIMPGTALQSRLEDTAAPATVWACMVFKRPGEEKRYAIQKAWRMPPGVPPGDMYVLAIDEGAVSPAVRDKLTCS